MQLLFSSSIRCSRKDIPFCIGLNDLVALPVKLELEDYFF